MSDAKERLETDPGTRARMSRQRRKSTDPERRVRSCLYAMGVRYRLHVRGLPGSPDIANQRRRWAIFVHGCYWHHHAGCARATIPQRNRPFWEAKFAANRKRDARKVGELEALGYRVLVIWECETRDSDSLSDKVQLFFRKAKEDRRGGATD